MDIESWAARAEGHSKQKESEARETEVTITKSDFFYWCDFFFNPVINYPVFSIFNLALSSFHFIKALQSESSIILMAETISL